MSKAGDAKEALQALLASTFRSCPGLTGTRACLAVENGGHPAGTQGNIMESTAYQATGELLVVFCPDGAPSSQAWALSAAHLVDTSGRPLPTHVEQFLERTAPSMTTDNLAGPVYPTATAATPVDTSVAQIFATYAPLHPISEEFKTFYLSTVSATDNYLQQYMPAYHMHTQAWTVQQTAGLYNGLLAAFGVPTPEHVTMLMQDAPAPTPEPLVVVVPPVMAPIPVPAPVALPVPMPMPLGTVPMPAPAIITPLPLVAPAAIAPLPPLVAPILVAAPLPLPVAVAVPAEAVLAVAPVETPARKTRTLRKAKATNEAGEPAAWLPVMAALLPHYFESPEEFEADVAAAVKAIKGL